MSGQKELPSPRYKVQRRVSVKQIINVLVLMGVPMALILYEVGHTPHCYGLSR